MLGDPWLLFHVLIESFAPHAVTCGEIKLVPLGKGPPQLGGFHLSRGGGDTAFFEKIPHSVFITTNGIQVLHALPWNDKAVLNPITTPGQRPIENSWEFG